MASVISANENIVSFRTSEALPFSGARIEFGPVQAGSGDPSPENIMPITGWTKIDVHNEGKNLFNQAKFSKAEEYHISGAYGYWYTDVVTLKPNSDYLISWSNDFTTETTDYTVLGIYYWENTDLPGTTDTRMYYYPINSSRNVRIKFRTGAYGYIRFACKGNTQNNLDDVYNRGNMQIELTSGNTPSEYEAYRGSVQTISWEDEAGTVYGGYIDPFRGKLVQTYWQYTFTGEETFNENGSNSWVTVYIQPKDGYYPTAAYPYEGVCSHYPYGPYGAGKIGVMYNERSCTFDYRIHDAAGWKQYCAEQYAAGTPVQVTYRLKNPIEYDINPIALSTMVGVNNFWSNANGTINEVAYRNSSTNIETYRDRIMNSPHVEEASGSIASFQTDMVAPVKGLKCHFNPLQAAGTPRPTNVLPISGWDGIDIYETAVNLLPYQNTASMRQVNKITISRIGNIVRINGTSSGSTYAGVSTTWVADGDKTYIYGVPDLTGTGAYWYVYDGANDLVSGENINGESFTAVSGKDVILAIAAPYGVSIDLEFQPVLCKQFNQTHISFPQTIYGGYVDFVKGVVVATYGKMHLDEDSGWTNFAQLDNGRTRVLAPTDADAIAQPGTTGIIRLDISDKFVSMPQNGYPFENRFCFASETAGRVFLGLPSSITSIEEFKTWFGNIGGADFVYLLDHPIEYPINNNVCKTIVGSNNVWTNANGITEMQFWTHQNGEGSVSDTSPVILEYEKRYTTTGATQTDENDCITKKYDINETFERRSFTIYGVMPSIVNYKDGVFKDYWNRTATSEEQTSICVSTDCNQVAFTLLTSMIDDCYAIDIKTGQIFFAGKNTQYYGHFNTNELS